MKLRPYYIILAVFIYFSSFYACERDEDAVTNHLPVNVQLNLESEWNLSQVDIIPHSRWSGILNDGSLVVVDHSLKTINLFDAEGNLMQSFGGEGRGPGEFSDITDAAIDPGGKVAVADIRNARITILDLFDGTVITSDHEPGWHTRLSWISDELVITNHPFRIGQSNPGDIIMRRIDPESGEKQEFYHLELEMEDPPFEQISCTFCEFRFQDDFSFFTSPQDTSYRIFKVNPKTEDQILFSRPGLPPVKLTEQEREVRKQQRERQTQMTGMSLDELDIPTYKSRFSDFFTDNDGRLWALLHTEEGDPYRFDLFSSEAEYIGSLDAPEGMESIEFTRNDKVLIRFDNGQDDELQLGLYKIVESDKGG